jgi:hypothetical protein
LFNSDSNEEDVAAGVEAEKEYEVETEEEAGGGGKGLLFGIAEDDGVGTRGWRKGLVGGFGLD